MTHFVGRNQSRETGRGGNGEVCGGGGGGGGGGFDPSDRQREKCISERMFACDELARGTNWAPGALNNILCLAPAAAPHGYGSKLPCRGGGGEGSSPTWFFFCRQTSPSSPLIPATGRGDAAGTPPATRVQVVAGFREERAPLSLS